MTDREPEAGHELVLDNRKLIIAFAVLIAICGAFFVLGFMEGRRQGFQDGMQTAVETAPGSTPVENPEAPPAEVPKGEIAASDLDWYRNVNRSEGDPAVAARLEPAPKPAEPPAPKPVEPPAPKPAPKPEPARPASARQAPSGSGTYSVQVGAFRARREAESVGRNLREKGFTGRIEVPDSADGLYLVKVGKFATRAEAAAVQLRLKNSGFHCFIKTN